MCSHMFAWLLSLHVQICSHECPCVWHQYRQGGSNVDVQQQGITNASALTHSRPLLFRLEAASCRWWTGRHGRRELPRASRSSWSVLCRGSNSPGPQHSMAYAGKQPSRGIWGSLGLLGGKHARRVVSGRQTTRNVPRLCAKTQTRWSRVRAAFKHFPHQELLAPLLASTHQPTPRSRASSLLDLCDSRYDGAMQGWPLLPPSWCSTIRRRALHLPHHTASSSP